MRWHQLLAPLISVICIAAPTLAQPSNEEPMYGGIPFTTEKQRLNDELIQRIVQDTGGREQGAERALKLGWNYYYERHDPGTAMKRFNHAWLLDPSNPEIFYAFGFLLSLQGRSQEAMKFFNETLERSPAHQMALADLGVCNKNEAYGLYRQKHLRMPDDEIKGMLKKSLLLFEEASQAPSVGAETRLSSPERDLRYVLYNWAVALEFNGEYANAWEKIKLCRAHGGEAIIESAFLQELSRFMPEPR